MAKPEDTFAFLEMAQQALGPLWRHRHEGLSSKRYWKFNEVVLSRQTLAEALSGGAAFAGRFGH